MRRAASVSDYRELARRRLPHFLFEYLDGGSYDEVTLRRNRADLEAVALRQLVLRDVSEIDVSAELFGQHWSLPVGLGPVGLAGMYGRRGEVQAARAARRAGLPFTLSTLAVCSVEEIARELKSLAPTSLSTGFWLQLYIIRDRGFVRDLLAQAHEANCGALLLTVDLPVSGTRYRDQRSGLAGGTRLQRARQAVLRPSWAWDVGVRGRPHSLGNLEPVLGSGSGMEDYFGWIGANFDASISWSDVAWVRANWDGPLVIKGILDPEDARQALASGADAILVSNHGGRQLDGVISTARALPSIAQVAGGRVPILVDGGVRSGLDVVRMLALGADFVMLGRAWAYALAAHGEAGVMHVLNLVEAEMRVAMALTGCTSIAAITADILDRR
jgi:L-lactate dehydrogenase (cytochrome)